MDVPKIIKQWLDEGDDTGPFEPSIILCTLAEVLEEKGRECQFSDVREALNKTAHAVRLAEATARDHDL